ncbi:hypothetical protein MsAg5_04460 [Methanosarcinaceae archaeon Ag5]|uniref:HTH cro/C1-type domain-containing protein n=1 Tax=Methanolapillus africanus TaxID=3028297 RepID=A0AAE4MIU4_9EURY|nr:hypothetical protein [Methanosarcinaceae archaeon Ag5]
MSSIISKTAGDLFMPSSNQGLKINPEILNWGRTSLNLSIEDVAKKMKQEPEIIQEWESGSNHPTYVQLENLSNIYKIPVAVFLFPEIPEAYKIRSSFRTLPDSAYEKLDAHMIQLFRNQKAIQENMKELDEISNKNEAAFSDKIENIRAGFQKKDFDCDSLRSFFSISLEQQKSWKDSKEALERWIFAFESKGILVTRDAFKNDDISGFCLYDDVYPLICLNNSHTENRCIFTLFHEFAHLVMQTGGIAERADYYIEELQPDDREIEIMCNKIAGKFLVPDDDFEKEVRRLQRDAKIGFCEEFVFELADIYHVSGEVILRKFLDFDIITPEIYNQLVLKWSNYAKNKKEDKKDEGKDSGGNYFSTKAVYLGDTYLKTVLSAYHENKITDMDASLYLGGVKTDNIPKLEEAAVKRWSKWNK